jgi:hypothetical protein
MPSPTPATREHTNRGSRHKPKWVGHIKYKGHKKWVGSHDNMEDYRKAEERCLAELREEVDNGPRQLAPTVAEFAGATFHENGRITMTWPDEEATQKETGRRDSSVRRLQLSSSASPQRLRPRRHHSAGLTRVRCDSHATISR